MYYVMMPAVENMLWGGVKCHLTGRGDFKIVPMGPGARPVGHTIRLIDGDHEDRAITDLPEQRGVVVTSSTYMATCWLRWGALGAVLKSGRLEDIASAVEMVVAGGAAIPPKIARLVLAQQEGRDGGGPDLTPREMHVARQIALGASSKEIAAPLNVAVKTVEAHRYNLMRKLDVHKSLDLVRLALRLGWINQDEL